MAHELLRIERKDGSRFTLVTAAHHFLLRALPLREPESPAALAAFVATVEQSSLPPAEMDAVLLRCLAVLDKHSEQRIPSLVDQYLLTATTPGEAVRHFSACVTRVLRHRSIRHGAVQHAVERIHRRLGESELTPRSIADQVGVQLSTLDVAFKRQMNCTLTEYVRAARLERAAVLLTTTGHAIKQVWTEVGYNYPSNFNHDFKRRFGLSPSDMRSRAILPFAQLRHAQAPTHATHRSSGPAAVDNGNCVLLVDNDECTTSHVGNDLFDHGYRVFVAQTGGEALAVVASHRPEIILVDYRLEDMDGVEFVRAVRRDSPGDTPAVALFTADWDLFERTSEVHALNAAIASKLCDLDHVRELVFTLSCAVASEK
jgi:AraC-like DNA-binding protein/CheY-like chemotaxis protein